MHCLSAAVRKTNWESPQKIHSICFYRAFVCDTSPGWNFNSKYLIGVRTTGSAAHLQRGDSSEVSSLSTSSLSTALPSLLCPSPSLSSFLPAAAAAAAVQQEWGNSAMQTQQQPQTIGPISVSRDMSGRASSQSQGETHSGVRRVCETEGWDWVGWMADGRKIEMKKFCVNNTLCVDV